MTTATAEEENESEKMEMEESSSGSTGRVGMFMYSNLTLCIDAPYIQPFLLQYLINLHLCISLLRRTYGGGQ